MFKRLPRKREFLILAPPVPQNKTQVRPSVGSRHPVHEAEPITVDSRSLSPVCATSSAPSSARIYEDPCPGYHLKLPKHASPFTPYLFLLYTRHTLPWKVIVDSERLILYSKRCTKVAHTSDKGKQTTPLSSQYCTQLSGLEIERHLQISRFTVRPQRTICFAGRPTSSAHFPSPEYR